MDITYRHIVGRIRSLLKLQSPDYLISDRLILSVLLPVNKKLVTQALQRRSGSDSPNLFTNIGCLELEKVALYSCCDTTSECMIAKSVEELPSVVDNYYGPAVRYVASVDGKVKFNLMNSPSQYANILKIYPNKKDKYFWIFNKHLYVTDPEVELVTISAFFSDLVDPEQFSSCKDNATCASNPLDLPFRSLPKLEDDIVNITTQEILSTFKQIPNDTSSNAQENT